ncbi:MAG: ATPase, T2SS/T4P/T4SS family [Candidatus Hadarchaeota archaeon]
MRGLENYVGIDKVKLKGRYIREYGEEDLNRIREYIEAVKDANYIALKNLSPTDCDKCVEKRKSKTEEIWSKLRESPSHGLHELKKTYERVMHRSEQGPKKCRSCRKDFSKDGLRKALEVISNTVIGSKSREEKPLENLFHPTMRPSFLNSRIRFRPSGDVKLVSSYEIEGNQVRIYYSEERLEHIYFLTPPEYRLPPEKVEAIKEVKGELLNKSGNLDSDLAREEIEKRSRKLLRKIALREGTDLNNSEIKDLSKSLGKFTAGLGIIETILSDPKIQDIYVDAPLGDAPLYCYHQEVEQCVTNVLLNPEEAKVINSKLRDRSGRPFSEADPTLNLNFGNVRVAAIRKPLSPDGLALAIRRHKSNPWTLPLFVNKDFMTPEAAGLLSLLVDSQCSMLITGSRGAGKTSLLGALMTELLPKFRILCMEDTSELPVQKLRSLNFKVQRLRTRPSNSRMQIEMSAEDALRAALRLGESVLIMGEVRGPETKSLYEAMRVGAAGNSVLGTIHGSTTKDVYERVVYDLDIPPSSFKATDAIVVAAPIRKKGGSKRIRRLTQISEVRKGWNEDPLSEDGFANLMKYDPEEDGIKPTKVLRKNSSHLLKSVAESWSMKLSEIVDNIRLRSKIQKKLAEMGSDQKEILSAENVVRSNLNFHRVLEEETVNGGPNYDKVYRRWEGWVEENLT